MFAVAGDSSFAGGSMTWNLLFARQPEPDLEFTEEELEQTTNMRSSPPRHSPKQSGGRPLLWVLLLVVVGAGAYAYMEPETVMDLVGPLLGESPMAQQEPPVAARPAPPVAPAPASPQQEPIASTPTPPPVPTPEGVSPVSPSVPAPGTTGAIPPPSPMTQPSQAGTPESAVPTPSIIDAPVPLFAEGQLVAVLPNPAAPGEKVALFQDATGIQPGPAIPPGTVLTILDGDLQNGSWMYSVRSNYGTKGWIAEKQLKPKS